jgi:hypothetical protein
MNTLQHTHDGTVITYNEKENKWEFTLRGRDRSAESLAKAKEFIERPVPAEKAKPFEKIPAWLFEHHNKPVRIEITGIAETPAHRLNEKHVWIKKGGKREKHRVSFCVFPATSLNDEIAAAIIEKTDEIRKLNKECSDLQRRLQPLELPKDE